MNIDLPDSWKQKLAEEFEKPYFSQLSDFVAQQRQSNEVFPPEENVFSAFKVTPYEDANVLILGQDPYHDNDQAHGMCFSVLPGIKIPPSLRNMYKELQSDLGLTTPDHGYLLSWAQQGILMLNAVLTVTAHKPNSHKNKGWEKLTDAVIRQLNLREKPVVFVLWGGYAQKKAKLIDRDHHTIIQSAHPSPLSARNGFFDSRPYSKINAALQKNGLPEIDWQLPMAV